MEIIAEQDRLLAEQCPAADSPELDVTGIDIGTINLAFCRIRICNGQPVIVWWRIVDLLGLGGGIAREACANLHKSLKPFLPCFADCPLFAIEQQPHFAGPMRNVAHGIVAYLHAVTTNEKCDTFMSAATNKLREFVDADKETYEERKASAIELIEQRLKDCTDERNKHFHTWYSSLPKKDDAADAWLHAFYTLENQKVKPFTSKKVKTLAQLSSKELQYELSSRGLPKTGTKVQLKQRLKIAKAGEAGKTSLTVTQLRAALTELGLDTKGEKIELAQRLYEAKKAKPRARKRARTKTGPN